MRNFKKIMSVVLAMTMLFTVAFSVSFVSKAEDDIAYSFSCSKWDWWGCSQGDAGQNNSALTRNYAEGYLTYDVSGSDFKQIQDKWKTMPAGDFYINFTNNTSQSVEVKIVASATLFDKWVGAGATQKIEFTNLSASNFSIFVMNWNTSLSVGTGLFTFSPIYYQPTVEGLYKWNLYSNKFSINSGATLAGGFNTQYSNAGTYFVSLDNAVGATATLTSLSPVEAGTYSAKLYARTTGNRASIDVSINDTKVASDLNTGPNGTNSMDYGFQLSNIEITESQPITLTITVTDTSQSGNLYLNSLELTKISSDKPEEPIEDEVLYKFIAANHNWSKTEGCNPNNNWAWGTFATTSYDYNSDGSVVVNTTAGSYDKFRQFNSYWNNVPAISDTAYIDITNNSTRLIKVKIATSGYTTPADSDLPTAKAGETLTIELGALNGGGIQIMLQDSYSSDEIICADSLFKISGIYKKAETQSTPVTAAVATVGGASIRLGDVNGVRFYTTVDEEALSTLVGDKDYEIGTIIAPADSLGDDNELTVDDRCIVVAYKARTADGKIKYHNNDSKIIAGSIVNIIEKTATDENGNIDRDFMARAYVKVGDKYYYSESATTRSLQSVASVFKDDNYGGMTLDEAVKKAVDNWSVGKQKDA